MPTRQSRISFGGSRGRSEAKSAADQMSVGSTMLSFGEYERDSRASSALSGAGWRSRISSTTGGADGRSTRVTSVAGSYRDELEISRFNQVKYLLSRRFLSAIQSERFHFNFPTTKGNAIVFNIMLMLLAIPMAILLIYCIYLAIMTSVAANKFEASGLDITNVIRWSEVIERMFLSKRHTQLFFNNTIALHQLQRTLNQEKDIIESIEMWPQFPNKEILPIRGNFKSTYMSGLNLFHGSIGRKNAYDYEFKYNTLLSQWQKSVTRSIGEKSQSGRRFIFQSHIQKLKIDFNAFMEIGLYEASIPATSQKSNERVDMLQLLTSIEHNTLVIQFVDSEMSDSFDITFDEVNLELISDIRKMLLKDDPLPNQEIFTTYLKRLQSDYNEALDTLAKFIDMDSQSGGGSYPNIAFGLFALATILLLTLYNFGVSFVINKVGDELRRLCNEIAHRKTRTDAVLTSSLPQHVVKCLKIGEIPPEETYENVVLVKITIRNAFETADERDASKLVVLAQNFVNLVNHVLQEECPDAILVRITAYSALISYGAPPKPKESEEQAITEKIKFAMTILRMHRLFEIEHISTSIGVAYSQMIGVIFDRKYPQYSIFGDPLDKVDGICALQVPDILVTPNFASLVRQANHHMVRVFASSHRIEDKTTTPLAFLATVKASED